MTTATLAACRDELDAAFEDRSAALGVVERRVLIAGRPVTLRFAGDRLVDDVTAAFAHLPPHGGEEGLTVNCWVADPERPLPRLPQEAFPDTSDGRHLAPALGRLRTHYDWEGRTLVVHDLDTATAWRCCVDPVESPWWDRAAPLRMVLAWHLEATGASFLHGAAIAREGRAALLVGPGGSGKSTTSLSCLLAGLDYLGDDYCGGSDDGRVHSLYGSAKVVPTARDQLDELLADETVGTHDEKVVVWPNRVLPDRMVTEAELDVVLVPTVSGAERTVATPVSAGAALAALAPSTVLQLPGLGPRALEQMARITRAAPCHRLDLGTDRAGVVAAVDEILAASAA